MNFDIIKKHHFLPCHCHLLMKFYQHIVVVLVLKESFHKIFKIYLGMKYKDIKKYIKYLRFISEYNIKI